MDRCAALLNCFRLPEMHAVTQSVTAIAHPNIAIIKYWGKRDETLNLPAAGSLSLTLGPIGTRTTVSWGHDADTLTLGDETLSGRELTKVSRFLDLVRAMQPGLGGAEVVSENDFPTASGLASSSSAFAALAVAATRAAELTLDERTLSVLARQGSGSAARSVCDGYARMHGGRRQDGTDAWAETVFPSNHWDLRVVIGVTTEAQKEVKSTDGMNLTMRTSPYYQAWVDSVEPSIEHAIEAITARDFSRLADLAEASALQMHASAIAAVPGVLYWRGATVELIHAVRQWREREGVPVFFTIDAGPHIKVFTPAAHASEVAERLQQVPGVVRTMMTHPAPGATTVEP
jgi:diphosphomevalonate decarboxylase